VKYLLALLLLVHGWYDKACCQDRDCHPVACERIVATHGGFEFTDYSGAVYFFTRDKMKSSQDGDCHACVHQETHTGLCLYLPVRT
jgi:hypothetical protein